MKFTLNEDIEQHYKITIGKGQYQDSYLVKAKDIDDALRIAREHAIRKGFKDYDAKEYVKEDIDKVIDAEVEEKPVVDEQVKNNALVTLLNDTINKEWDELNNLNSTLATIKYEAPEKEDVISIIDNIITEKNIHIGMLTKALELINPETHELMDAGIEKAEAVIAEPATNDLDGK